MKNFKKIASAIAALSLAACVAVPMSATVFTASAADITINPASGDTATHTYSAYQIFDGDLTTDAESNKVLSNITWGAGVNKGSNGIPTVEERTIYNELKDLTLSNNPFKDAEGNALTTAQEVADALSKATKDTDDEIAVAFANVIVKYLGTTAQGTATASPYTMSDLNDGYYLVRDTTALTGNDKNGAETRFILEVAGENVTATAKSSFPTVVKKVQENTSITGYTEMGETDPNYNDIADYNIGDAVPFRLYGSMPSTIGDYDHYKYIFHDTLDADKFETPTSVTVRIRTAGSEWELDPSDSIYEFTSSSTSDGCSFEVSFADILKTGLQGKAVTSTEGKETVAAEKTDITIDASTIVEVSYTAKLTKDAVLGTDGQRNKVKLEYSTNPYWDGTPSSGSDHTDETPEDGVIVFTYGVDINKVKENGTDKLEGAKFAVYKLEGVDKKYIKTDANGKYAGIFTSTPDFESVTSTDGTEGVFVSDKTNNIKIEGLDAGTYYIEELAAPSGYNKLTDEIKVVVTPTIKEDRNGWTYGEGSDKAKEALSALVIKYGEEDTYNDSTAENANATVETGKGTVKIENQKGATLPSTGGIGTTLFYLGGGALVAVAGVMLITKKRMTKD